MERTLVKLAIGIILFAMAVPVSFIVLKFSLEQAGYHVCINGCWDFDEQFIAENIPASECFNIISLDIVPGPSTSDFRNGCFEKVSRGLKDVSACKNKSRYSTKCLNYLQEDFSTAIRCSTIFDNRIGCTDGTISKDYGIDTCLDYTEKSLRDWCHMERTRTLPSVNECSFVSSEPPELRWECQLDLARKEENFDLCTEIADTRWKELCKAWIEADGQKE